MGLLLLHMEPESQLCVSQYRGISALVIQASYEHAFCKWGFRQLSHISVHSAHSCDTTQLGVMNNVKVGLGCGSSERCSSSAFNLQGDGKSCDGCSVKGLCQDMGNWLHPRSLLHSISFRRRLIESISRCIPACSCWMELHHINPDMNTGPFQLEDSHSSSSFNEGVQSNSPHCYLLIRAPSLHWGNLTTPSQPKHYQWSFTSVFTLTRVHHRV